MPIRMILPPVDYLRACFDYDPDTGIIRWRTRPREHFDSPHAYGVHYSRFAGKAVSNIEKGYLIVTLNGVHYRAARVIWKLVTWEEPPAIVDHLDRDKLNNRWANLRVATPAQSVHNRRRRPGASGLRGVRKRGNRWYAQIYCNGTTRHLGIFETANHAAMAYEDAARELHGKFYAE